MFDNQSNTSSAPTQPAQPKFIRATDLPMRVTVTNPDDFCFFNHDYFKAFPVKTGDTVTVIARGAGMFSWYTFVLDGESGQGTPSGIAHINGFAAAEGK